MIEYRSVRIPGTSVTASLGVTDSGDQWNYALMSETHPGVRDYIAHGTLNMVSDDGELICRLTPEQAARVAFILEFDYADLRKKM